MDYSHYPQLYTYIHIENSLTLHLPCVWFRRNASAWCRRASGRADRTCARGPGPSESLGRDSRPSAPSPDKRPETRPRTSAAWTRSRVQLSAGRTRGLIRVFPRGTRDGDEGEKAFRISDSQRKCFSSRLLDGSWVWRPEPGVWMNLMWWGMDGWKLEAFEWYCIIDNLSEVYTLLILSVCINCV